MKKNYVAYGLAFLIATAGLGVNTVYAEDTQTQLNPVINKTVEVNKGEFTPKMHFEFEVAPGTAVEAKDGKPAVYAGLADSVSIANIDIAESESVAEANIEKTAAITVDASKFTTPGIYVYKVNEKAGIFEGMNYDETSYNLYVQVVNNEDNGIEVAGYWFAAADNPLEKVDGNFTNKYIHGEGENQTHNLTVTKQLKGNMADKNKEFKFTVSIASADDYDVFTVVAADGTKTKLQNINGKNSVTLKLKGGQSFQVLGATNTDQIKVVEEDYTAEGYTTENKETTSTMAKDTEVTVTNTKNEATPTGLFLAYGPYIAMIAAAGALLVISKKKRED